MKDVPSGYSLEITAPPEQPNEPSYVYVAAYRTKQNDYFVIQGGMSADNVPALKAAADEVYTTASGLVVMFEKDTADSSGKVYVSATVSAPDGVTFMITSTLPRETVKAWAENLTPAK